MSSRPSAHDERASPNDESDAGSLGAIVSVGDFGVHDVFIRTGTDVTTDTAVVTDEAVTTDEAATTDEADHAGTAVTSKSAIHSRISQQTSLRSSLENESSGTYALRSPILTSSVDYKTDDNGPRIPRPLTPRQQDADMATTTTPRVGPLTISDLPNEVLEMIFSLLTGGKSWRDTNETTWDFTPSSKQDIKNVRLCCRSLSACASRHLIRHVRLDFSEDSLAKLERISHHPDIRHGVQAIEVCLAQYDDGLASNLEGFARHHMNNIGPPYVHSQETVKKAESVSRAWNKYLEAYGSGDDTFLDKFDREEIDYVHALVQGYDLWKQGLQSQQSLLAANDFDGFTVRFAASMARLPVVEHLEVNDCTSIHYGKQSRLRVQRLNLSNNEALVDSLAQWRSPFDEVQGTLLLSLIPGLLSIGLRQPDETGITSLNIQISSPSDSYTQLSLLHLQDDQVRTSLRNLRSFRFENHYFERGQQGIQPLAGFLDACLESEQLECLVINPKLWALRENPIRPRAWPKLRYAVLKSLPISKSNLEVLTAPIASRPQFVLMMDSVSLFGGKWADVLDTLRNRRVRVGLGLQRGAECHTMDDWGIGVFCRNGRLPSVAEYYIQGEDMPNPMLSTPSEELRDRLFSLPSSHQVRLETFDRDF